jgi:hypothetical protein
MSRYYNWRVAGFANALIEGVVFLSILLISLVLLSVAIANLETFMAANLYVLFVMFLSFMSSMQMAWRVREINQRESNILSSLGASIDKIGVARDIVENLMIQGSMGDGRVWFALYRLAQRPNQVGWAIRDVLIEKGREMKEMYKYETREPDSAVRDKGPGIES